MAPPAALPVEARGLTDTSPITLPGPILATSSHTHAVFGVPDVQPHRECCPPLPRGVAAFASSEMFKSPANKAKPKARRWDARLSRESAARKKSSLKGAAAYLKIPGIISLGGGLPSPEYFPFESVSVRVPVAPAFTEDETGHTGATLSTGRYDVRQGASVYDLSIAMNYGQATGAAQLLRFVTEHTEIVHAPRYADWECCLTTGSTSALEMAMRMFLEPGDWILTEEYTFSSALETAGPLGARVCGVGMDGEGLLPKELDRVLSDWDAEKRGRKPVLLYTVPTGQNPTGATQSLARRKAVMEVCERHDLLVIEDDPYFFLQMEEYVSPEERGLGEVNGTTSATTNGTAATNGHRGGQHPATLSPKFKPTSVHAFLSALTPSLLSLDPHGRVLRLDSFSKIIAPGSRTGWITAPAQLIERFVRHSEVSTQNPSGLSQVVLFKLLDEEWGHEGFLQWLMFIRAEYSRRRDVIVAAAERHLPRHLCIWNPVRAGMFFWIRIDWRRHPLAATLGPGGEPRCGPPPSALEIEERIFHTAIANGVLCSRGSWFRAQKGSDSEVFLRLTFAAASEEQIVEGVGRLADAVRREFELD